MLGMRDRPGGLTLRTMIVLIVVAFGLLPTLSLSLVSYAKLSALLEDRLAAYASATVRQAADSLGSLLRQAEAAQMQVVLRLNAETDRLALEPSDPAELARRAREMTEFLQNLRLSSGFISNIFVLTDGGEVYSSAVIFDEAALMAQPWIADLQGGSGSRERVVLHPGDYVGRGLPPPLVLTLALRIRHGADRPERGMLILVDLSSSVQNAASITATLRLASIGREGDVLLVGRDGTVLASGKPEQIGRAFDEWYDACALDREADSESVTHRCNGTLAVQQGIGDLGWMVAVVPLAAFLGEFHQVRNLFLGLSAGFVLLTVVLSVMLAGLITRPLRKLHDAMGRVRDGNLAARVPLEGTREIAQLSQSFNDMGARIRALLKAVSLKEREAVRAELLALQLQINPHFLYNALEVMRGSARARGATEAAEIAHSLSALLRYSSSRDGSDATVDDEAGSLRHYLRIQRHRFGERFAAEIDIAPAAAAARVPRFILQPLVENVFAHAVERSQRPVRFAVTARVDGRDLVIEVRDDGAGMGPTELAAIRRGLAAGTESRNTGIGLPNVHNRIRLSFGLRYGVSIDPVSPRGTSVVVRLPLARRRRGRL